MIFELKADRAQVTTDCPVYKLEPGGLYVVQLPETWTVRDYVALKALFAQDKQVLTPPATFLFVQAGIDVTEAPADYLQRMIARAKAILDERHADGVADPD